MLNKTDKTVRNPEIVMAPISDLFLATEAPKGIDLVVRNSSSGSPLTDAELKASIYTKGIIHPLLYKVVQGKYYVIAGNRRLRILREIFADSPDIKVPIQNVVDFEGDWREIAMDTNLALPPHLVERYEVIVALVKDLKLSPDDARLRFGMTPRQFDQVMALGKMSPLIREKWKAGEINAKTAQAFTLEPNPKEQDKIYEAAKKKSYQGRVDAGDIKDRIIPANQRDAGALVAFVGIETCKKAKIIKQEDLFSTSHIVTDIKALNKLAGDKLSVKCIDLVDDDGWSWAIPENKIEGNSWSYGRIEPSISAKPTAVEKARLAEIKQLLDSNSAGNEYDDGPLIDEQKKIEEAIKARGYTAAQRAKGGCIVKINHDGALAIEYGRVKPEEKKKVASSERPKSTRPKTGKDAMMTSALIERLSTQLQKAGAEVLKTDHAVAVSALIAGFASAGDVIDVKAGIGAIRGSRTSSFGQVFVAALESTPEQRAAMLAQIAAQALSIITYNPLSLPLSDENIFSLFKALKGPAVEKAIANAFDIKDYFAAVSGDVIVEAIKCVMGSDHAAKVAKMDKGTKTKFAVENLSFAKTGWLPKPLRTAWYMGPTETETGKKQPSGKKRGRPPGSKNKTGKNKTKK